MKNKKIDSPGKLRSLRHRISAAFSLLFHRQSYVVILIGKHSHSFMPPDISVMSKGSCLEKRFAAKVLDNYISEQHKNHVGEQSVIRQVEELLKGGSNG